VDISTIGCNSNDVQFCNGATHFFTKYVGNWQSWWHSNLFHCWHVTVYVPVAFEDSQFLSSRANLLLGGNRPKEPWPIRSLELSLPGRFAPGPFRSLAHSLPCCLVRWNFRSPERNSPRTFIPLVHDVDTQYPNDTLLLMRTWLNVARCGIHDLSQTLVNWPSHQPDAINTHLHPLSGQLLT